MYQGESLISFVNERRLEIGLMLLGLTLVGVGVFISKSGDNTPSVEIVKVGGEATGSGLLVVDVSGAIVKSGVYRLPADTRVGEAIIVAGGLAPEADVNWVEANVNRAKKITDGEKIFIPAVNSEVTILQSSKKISINSAGESELDTLSGVGPATAQKIITGRPYGKLEDLVERKIVGQKVFEQIKDKIELW